MSWSHANTLEMPLPISANTVTRIQPDEHIVSTALNIVALSEDRTPSKTQTIIVISSVSVITGIGSMLSGLVTVSIPTIARDINFPQDLLLW